MHLGCQKLHAGRHILEYIGHLLKHSHTLQYITNINYFFAELLTRRFFLYKVIAIGVLGYTPVNL